MGCICQKCGSIYKMDLIIPDELWDNIKNVIIEDDLNDDWWERAMRNEQRKKLNLLCSSCIVKAIEKIKEYCAYKLIEL